MPSPRRRFECLACEGTHVLPVAAKFCPETGALVTPLFDEVQVAKPRQRAKSKMVDKYAVKALEEVTPKGPPVPPGFQSQVLPAGAVLGSLNAGARSGSAMPILSGLKGLGGPMPGPGSKT